MRFNISIKMILRGISSVFRISTSKPPVENIAIANKFLPNKLPLLTGKVYKGKKINFLAIRPQIPSSKDISATDATPASSFGSTTKPSLSPANVSRALQSVKRDFPSYSEVEKLLDEKTKETLSKIDKSKD
jgi:hypothetical protein